jgi:hypothetical protein
MSGSQARPSFLKKRTKKLPNADAALSGKIRTSVWKSFASFL